MLELINQNFQEKNFWQNVGNGTLNMVEKFKINLEKCERVAIGQKRSSLLMTI
jgi:predicted hydrolase (HD superfamily)